MEFFHNPKIDWMGKKWYFISVSLAILIIGLISMSTHGLDYGIEFRSGTQVTVKFAKAPQVNQIRHDLEAEGVKNATIQSIGAAADHEVMIELPLAANESGAAALDTGRTEIINALNKQYGTGAAGKTDFNNASAKTISQHLLVADPLGLAAKGIDTATSTYQNLANALVAYRNKPPQSGLISDFHQLSSVPGVTPAVINSLSGDFYLSSFAVRNTEIVGPKVGSDLRKQAVYVTLAGLLAMLIYIWFRFELIYGVSAVIAVFHDTIITIGIFSLFHKEITLSVIAALLTLVGYSMNDTIVVFDRIRENVRANKRENFLELVNRSINQTLSRTVLTSGLTFLAVLALYIFGGEVIHGFAFALVVGVLIGTYSSIAIASPILVYWQNKMGKGGMQVKEKDKEKPKPYARREIATARR